MILKAIWLLLVLMSLAASTLFVAGVRRDMRAGEPEIAVDLSQRSNWVQERFRVPENSQHTLYLTSVNHTPPFGTPFGGAVAVRINDPADRVVFDRRFEGGSTDHVRPDNIHWTTLARLTLSGAKRGWTVEARVVEPDSAFAGVISRVLLRRDRDDPGMGGMINYVMPIPALAFALLSLLLGGVISHRAGGRFPIAVSTALLLATVATILFGRI